MSARAHIPHQATHRDRSITCATRLDSTDAASRRPALHAEELEDVVRAGAVLGIFPRLLKLDVRRSISPRSNSPHAPRASLSLRPRPDARPPSAVELELGRENILYPNCPA
eukprot:1490230-Rhodomonas_salina.2